MSFNRLVLASFACLAFMQPQVVEGQEQAEFVRTVQHGTRFEQIQLMDHLRLLEPRAIQPALRDVLIKALEREADLSKRRRRGEIEHFQEPELVARIAMIVAKFEDPRAIPGLAGAVGYSASAGSALAEFGEPAAEAVVRVIADNESPNMRVGAMVCLRFMLEGAGREPLSTASRAAIRRVATQYLNEDQDFVTLLWRAIDLAIALDDPELRTTVEGLASDPEAVAARGVTDPDLISKTQERASDRLSGVPPLPRRRPIGR